jgi:hypothetical protein
MSKYEYLYTAGRHEDVAEMFALKTPGVKAEHVGGGVYEGAESIKRLYVDFPKYREGDRIGIMAAHTLTTPIIEVAGDGRTAKAMWLSPGFGTTKNEGKLEANWNWGKYGVDFVKEDGKWKIWHLHMYGIFCTPYEKSWVDGSGEPSFPPFPDELKADRPSAYHRPYGPTTVTEYVPPVPEPYETWDEATAYVK